MIMLKGNLLKTGKDPLEPSLQNGAYRHEELSGKVISRT